MPGCNLCRFHESKLNWGDDGKLLPSTYSCSNGKNTETNEWWKNNGRKLSEPLDDMICHDFTDSRKTLNSMSDKLDEMLKLVKSENK